MLTVSTQTDFNVAIESQLRMLLDRMEQELEDTQEILRKTHGIFRRIRNRPFQKVAYELKLCATIGAKCPSLNSYSAFEQAFSMQNFYLEHDNSDRTLVQACLATRDRFLETFPDVNVGPVLSEILDERVQEDLISADQRSEHGDKISRGVQVDIIPSDVPDHFFSRRRHDPKNTFSEEVLKERFEALQNKINANMTIPKEVYTSLLDDVMDYSRWLKHKYPLRALTTYDENDPIIHGLRFATEVYGARLRYFKAQRENDFDELDDVLRNNAFLLRILADYYQQTNATEAQKRACRMNATSAYASAYNMKGILACEHVILSEETFPEEKRRAKESQDKLCALDEHGVKDYLSEAIANEAWSMAFYDCLKQNLEMVSHSLPPLPFYPLLWNITQYLDQTLRQYSDAKIHVCYVDKQEDYFLEDVDIAGTLISVLSSQERAHLLKVLELYYDTKIAHLQQTYMLSYGFPSAEQGVPQICIYQKSECDINRDVYCYLLKGSLGQTAQQRIEQYQYILTNQHHYNSPLIRTLALHDLKLAQEEQRQAQVSLRNQIPNTTSEEPMPSVETLSKSTGKNAARRKKDKERKERSKQWEKIEKAYEKRLVFTPSWTASRSTIITLFTARSYTDARAFVDMALAGNTLGADEKLDAFILKIFILRKQGAPAEIPSVLNEAWSHIPSEPSTKIDYMQKEVLLLERRLCLREKGEDGLALLAIVEAAEKIAQDNDTFCFPLLLEKLRAILDRNLVLTSYQDTITRLMDAETLLLINEYYLSDFFSLYETLAWSCHAKGKTLLKEAQPNTKLARQYLEQSIQIFICLMSYARAYNSAHAFELQMCVVNMCKYAHDIDRRRQYIDDAKSISADALKFAEKLGDPSLIQRAQEVVSELREENSLQSARAKSQERKTPGLFNKKRSKNDEQAKLVMTGPK